MKPETAGNVKPDVVVAASQIGSNQYLVEGEFRLPWKYHQPFGFGDGWPTYTVDPLLRLMATPLHRPTSWPLIWKTWERERQARKAWEHAVKSHIVRMNSTPERCHFMAAHRFLDRLRPQLSFLDLDLNEVGISAKPPHEPRVGRLVTAERWEHYAVADLLIRTLLPHLTQEELKQPERSWQTLCRRFRQYEQFLPRVNLTERLRRKNAFLLAVYERTLSVQTDQPRQGSLTTDLLDAFTKYAALGLRGQP